MLLGRLHQAVHGHDHLQGRQFVVGQVDLALQLARQIDEEHGDGDQGHQADEGEFLRIGQPMHQGNGRCKQDLHHFFRLQVEQRLAVCAAFLPRVFF